MSDAPYPEPAGYMSSPGFVKSNPDNNEHYISSFKGDKWYPVLRATHDAIKRLAPDYNIAQIKDKFGGLRYYYDLPEGTPDEIATKVYNIVLRAEYWVDGYERAMAEVNGKAVIGTYWADDDEEV